MDAAAAEQAGSAVRVIRLRIPNHMLSEQLFGSGIEVAACEVVFRHMLPAPSTGTLHGVLKHGLAVVYDEVLAGQPSGLLVPWTQIAYVRFFAPEPQELS